MMNNEETMAAVNNEQVTNDFGNARAKRRKALIGVLIAALYWIPDLALLILFPELDITVFFIIMFASSITAYILTGGLDMVFGIAKKIAFFGWFILPFPMDIITGFTTFFLALFLFAGFPIVFAVIGCIRIFKETSNVEQAA